MKRLVVIILLTLAAICVISSCKPKPSKRVDGQLVGSTYTYSKFGWEIAVPEGWEQIPDETLMLLKSEKQQRAVDKTLYAASDLDNEVMLLCLQKGDSSFFFSRYTPFNQPDGNGWESYFSRQKERQISAFESEYELVDSSKTVKDRVGGVNFLFYTLRIVQSTEKELFTTAYCGFINGYIFQVDIISSSKEDENTLRNMWNECLFNHLVIY